MNRLYFVQEYDENVGIFVAEENNNQAKLYACSEFDCSYIEARARLVKEGQTYYDDIDTQETGV